MKNISPAWLVIVIAALFSFPAAAGPLAAGMTEDSIRAYYRESLDALKGPYTAYIEFMNKTTSDNFTSFLKMTTKVSGQRPTVSTDRQTKHSLLAGAKAAYRAVKEASISYEIKKITIAPDGRSASAITDTIIKNLAVAAAHDRVLLGTSKGECIDDFVLGPNGVLQLAKETCKADLTVSEGQSL